MFAQVLDCQFWALFPFGQQHVDNTSTDSATGSVTERKQPLPGRTSRASLQFMNHFVGIDAKEQRNCTQLFALLNFNPEQDEQNKRHNDNRCLHAPLL